MTFFLAWVVFPVLLGVISLGCGLLIEYAGGWQIPTALLLPIGFAVFSLVTQFAQLTDATAGFSTPAVIAVALAGYWLSLPRWGGRRVDPALGAAALGVYAVYGAPVLLSGRATFAGYIKLDDTANYMALLDRGMHHGYNIAGLPPATYEAYLDSIYKFGYPLGSFLPLGVGSTILGQDALWLWQPYLTFLVVMLALAIYQLSSSVVASPWLRAGIAFVASQAALLYGYALWGGVKELATSAFIVLLVALVPLTVRESEPRAVLPLAAASAGVVGALSVAGAAWLPVPFIGAYVLWHRRRGAEEALKTAGAFVGAALVLGIPALVAAKLWLPNASKFTNSSEYANLLRKIGGFQAFGIWPSGDFRTLPMHYDLTRLAAGVVLAAMIYGLFAAWKRDAFELGFLIASAFLACFVYVGFGSPWIGGKTLASASPIVLAIAMIGIAAAFERGWKLPAAAVGVVVIGGVLWSNVLQYHAVSLAPSDTMSELSAIGKRYSGQGPTLMTEYQAYGVRHFLRNMAAEGASELRRHNDFLYSGAVADPGASIDIDEMKLNDGTGGGVLYYRTLVLRRSPLASRPPSSYQLVSSGKYYEVWQRGPLPSNIIEHYSLGNRFRPTGIAPCNQVLRLAGLARKTGGLLATVYRPRTVVIEPDGRVGAPAVSSLRNYGEDPSSPYATKAFAIQTPFDVPVTGTYGVWVGGTFQARVDILVDGKHVGSVRNVVAWPATFVPLGSLPLARGTHTLLLRYSGPDNRPGSAGVPEFGLGPIAIGIGTADRPVSYVKPSQARTLCGKRLDWIEAVRGT